MSKIIFIDDLYVDNFKFGYVGKDLTDGNIRYFRYDNNSHMLSEITLKSLQNQFLKDFVNLSGYGKECESTKKKEILNSFIEQCLDEHLAYNNKNNYPNVDLKQNQDFLTIIPTSVTPSYYSALENSITISTYTDDLQDLSNRKEKKIKDNLLLAIGQLKASNLNFDWNNNTIIVKCGYITDVIKFEPIKLSNGDIFIKILGYVSYRDENAEILEEITNTYDCKQVNSKYKTGFPNFGAELNYLCDGKLQAIRYEQDALNKYYDVMKETTKSKYLAEDLLQMINDSEYGSNKIANYRKALTLIKYGKNVKNKSK